MDKSVAKWLVRAGSLLIVLGFFLPSVAVSCSALGVTQTQSFSMNQLASGTTNQSLLYLVLLGAVVTLFVAFVPARDNQGRLLLLLGQVIGLGLGLLSVFVVVISLSGQMQQLGMKTSFDVGFFVLLFGYGLGGVGVILQLLLPGQTPSPRAYSNASPGPQPAPAQAEYSPPPQPVSGPRLELVRGNAPSPVYIQTTDFQIGRSTRNHLVLSDPRASGSHIRLRFAQGAWFIQDQDSSNGTFVNSKRITAQRLNDGDQIRVGETTYVFRI